MTSKKVSTLDNWVVRASQTSNPRSSKDKVQSTLEPESSSKKRGHIDSIEDPTPVRKKLANIGEVDVSSLESDPGLRKPISDYDPNQQDVIRREYLLQKGPCQPCDYDFSLTQFGKQQRRFNKQWFREFNWLEYSVSNDAAFCLYCYLFTRDVGADCFVLSGFKNWKKKERLREHMGEVGSAHNLAYMKGQNLINQNQHIDIALVKQSEQEREDYKDRLECSVKVVRLLLELGIPFRGHDESDESERQGNFLTVLRFLTENNSKAKQLKENTPKNAKMTAPKIQKDIVRACAIETVNIIRNDIGDTYFALLVDESRDISIKEQMVIAVRYVDKRGYIMERVIGFVHVTETTSLTLKKGIDELLSKHNLCTNKIRGQGYDGASNMRGEYNGVKTLFLEENKHAFYVHCFAHQLQLTLVNVAKNFRPIMNFFDTISEIVTQVGSSCKRKDALRKIQLEKVLGAIQSGELMTGRGLNQKTSLKRAGDTRWGSHYDTLLRFICMFSAVVDLLDIINEDGETKETRGKAEALGDIMTTYDFVFKLYMMKTILGITKSLSKSLQRRDQDIVNAMVLVRLCKQRFQDLRDNGWDDLISGAYKLCSDNNIEVPNMEDKFIAPGRSRRGEETTNKHHYCVCLFYVVIDMQLSELDSRFPELETELLSCMGSLSPTHAFSAFNKNDLIRLAAFYDTEFSKGDLLALGDELDMYLLDVLSDVCFSQLNGISELSIIMVETGKNLAYPLVYSLVTLALILPVATATVERAFSAMKFIKTQLRNRMGDVWMSDSLITYIEKDIFLAISIKTIAKRFQGLQNRPKQLPIDY